MWMSGLCLQLFGCVLCVLFVYIDAKKIFLWVCSLRFIKGSEKCIVKFSAYLQLVVVRCINQIICLQLQLVSLMDTLNSTEPHYIRCVKPNNVLKPAIFENVNIIQQLRCGVSILGNLDLAWNIIWSYKRCLSFELSLSLCGESCNTIFGTMQGVLEAIRISCAGYPTRRLFDEFLLRFGVLAPEVLDGK